MTTIAATESALRPDQLPAPPPSFVYALGRIEPQFANISIEKELAQAVGRISTAGQTERQAMMNVLGDRANRYLARRMCWVFSVAGMETYLVAPRDPSDLDLLIDSMRERNNADGIDVLIGVRGPIASPQLCNGLALPIVYFDQLYSFGRDELLQSVPRPADIPESDEEQFRSSAGHLFERVIQISENAGSTDEHRAINYLAVRYPAIYARAAAADRSEASLSSVITRLSPLSTSRKIVEVVFSFTHRRTDVVDMYSVKVDVEDEFPFLVGKLSPYYERS